MERASLTPYASSYLPPPSLARDRMLMVLLLPGPARMLGGPGLDSDPDVPGLDGKPDNSALIQTIQGIPLFYLLERTSTVPLRHPYNSSDTKT